MNRLVWICERDFFDREFEAQLRGFFTKIRDIKMNLDKKEPYLNRIQRIRCRDNILKLEMLEREFHSIEYREDFEYIHKKLRRYLYLNRKDLTIVLSQESLKRDLSLFLLK